MRLQHHHQQQRLYSTAAVSQHQPVLPHPVTHTVTLTTQCSLDRWPRFQQHAESWGGPASVAVYIPAPQHTAAADASVQLLQQWADAYAADHPEQHLNVTALFANHNAREGASVLAKAGFDLAGCSQFPTGSSSTTSAAVTTPPSSSTSIPYEQLYPINALRNLAIDASSTPLVLPVDADFVFSAGLQQQLHRPAPAYSQLDPAAAATCLSSKAAGTRAAGSDPQASPGGLSLVQQLLLSHQQQQQQPSSTPVMLVLPAFQLATQQVADSQRVEVPTTKKELLEALQAGTVRPFDCGVFAPQQQPLDIAAWCAAEEPFELQYVDLFEVHGGISIKQQLPPYSEAFRGYGLNKQQHAWHAAALGFRFTVLPDAFMVTVPHKRSSSWRPSPGTAADTTHLERIRGVYAEWKQQLAEQQGLSAL